MLELHSRELRSLTEYLCAYAELLFLDQALVHTSSQEGGTVPLVKQFQGSAIKLLSSLFRLDWKPQDTAA